MKIVLGLYLFIFLLVSCDKDSNNTTTGCNIQDVHSDNSEKVTISSGVWGTVSLVEGNCMPQVPAISLQCRNCPVKRTVRIYQYTTKNEAITSDPYKVFYDSFNTQLVAQVDTDEGGFFQAELAAGHYTIVAIENGKLYANTGDGQGGLSPFILDKGTKNINLEISYKATF